MTTTTKNPVIIVGVKYKLINLVASLIKKTSENIRGVPRKCVTMALASDKNPHKKVISDTINTFRFVTKITLKLVKTMKKLTIK